MDQSGTPASAAGPTEEAAWVRTRSTEEDLRRYLSVAWMHRRLVAICLIGGILIAVAYVLNAQPVYSAETDFFISPVSTANSTIASLGLITDSGDPTSNAETAARLITTLQAAQATRAQLELAQSPQQILSHVSGQPIAQSNIVALTAEADSGADAANLANAFAQNVIRLRTAQFRTLVQGQLANLNAQLRGINAGSADAGVLQGDLSLLRTYLTAPLPDMRIASPATSPSSPSSPKAKLTVIGGALGGLALGLILAFILEFVDIRVQRPQDLQRLFRLPILAMIPRADQEQEPFLARLAMRLPIAVTLLERRQLRYAVPRAPQALPPLVLEAYRTLRATLTSSSTLLSSGGSILVTSATASEGKTTSAINLAYSLVHAGHSVILLEADLHRPSIAKTLGLRAPHGMAQTLIGEISVQDALIESPEYGELLRFLVAGSGENDVLVADALLRPGASLLLAEALRLADYVIVDAPPLAEVIDALELAKLVDEVLLVVRLGRARVPRLAALGQLLARAGVSPVGIALIGTEQPRGYDAYGYGYASYSRRAELASGRPPAESRSS